MAMDKRQTGIVEGAGLNESRLNQDFIAFLNKWSSPLLFTLALIAGGWWFWNYRQDQQASFVDAAHVQLENAVMAGNPNPVTLVTLAEEYSGVAGIAPRALLAAADVRLSAASRGVVPGSIVNQDGTVNESDLLNEEERTDEYEKAADLYKRVWNLTKDDSAMTLHALGAASGLAAVAESLSDVEGAKAYYQQVVDLAERSKYEVHAAIARQRMASIERRMAERPKLYAKSELPTGVADRPGGVGQGGMDAVTPEIIDGAIEPLMGTVEVQGPEAPVSDPASDPVGVPQSDEPQPNPGTEPAGEPATEPATEPAAEPTPEPAAEPASGPGR